MRKLIVHFTILSLVIINYSCEKSITVPADDANPNKRTYSYIKNERQKTVEVINSYSDINYHDTIVIKPKETKLYIYDVQFHVNEVVILEEDSAIYQYHVNGSDSYPDFFKTTSWDKLGYYTPYYDKNQNIRYKTTNYWLFIIE